MSTCWSGYKKITSDESLSKNETYIHKIVFSALRKKWIELHDGNKDCEDNRDLKKAVLKEIEKKIDSHSYNDAIRFFAKLIEIGNIEGRWHITIPPYHQTVRRERSPFTSYSFKNNEFSNNLNDFMKKILSSKDSIDNKDLSIIILISAIINGGVLTWERIAGVCRITDSMIRSEEGLIRVDVEIESSDRTGMFSKKENSTTTLWRWYPDSMTAFLLHVWKKKTNKPLYNDMDLHRISDKGVMTNIIYYLKHHNYERNMLPDSLSKLIECGKSHLSFNVPGFLVQYASGRNKSSSLMALPYARVRTNRAGIINSKEEYYEQDKTIELSMPIKEIRQDMRALEGNILKIIRPMIHAACKDKVKLSNDIKREIDKHNIVTSSLFGAVINWIIYMLEKDTLKRNKIKIKSIYEYVCALAPRLVSYGSGLDMITSNEDHFLDLYGSVLADCSSDNRRQFVSSRIKEFHDFIREKYGAAKIDFNEIDGFLKGGGAVSSNVITPQEYNNILLLLTPKNAVLHRRLEVSVLIVMLGFRLGLRLGEVLRITLNDITFGESGEIFIQANVYGELKTRNARRRLPIGILVPNHERDRLQQWHTIRSNEIGNKAKDNALLFTLEPIQDNLIRMDAVLPDIHKAMRLVTGDETVRYHIFRHSFANWLLIRLVANEIPGAIDSRISAFDDIMFSDEECRSLRTYFFPQGYTDNSNLHPVRSALYQLAQLMGHSSADITLKHYVHICDYLLGKSLPNTLDWIDVKTFIKLTNMRKSSAYTYLKLLGNLEPGNHQFFKRLSRWANIQTDPIDSQLSIPNLKPLVDEVEDTKFSLQADSIFEVFKDLWTAADKKVKEEKGKKSHKITIDGIIQSKLVILSKQKELNIHILNQWRKATLNFQKKYRTRTKKNIHPRLPLLPNMKLGYEVEKETKKLLTLLLTKSENDNERIVEYGIKTFLEHVTADNSEVRFIGFDEAVKYLKFLKILELEDDRIRIYYLEGLVSDSNEQIQRRTAWEKILGLPVNLLPINSSRTAQRSTKYGSVGISVDSSCFTKLQKLNDMKNSPSRRATPAFRTAIQIFEILQIKNNTFTIHCRDVA